MLYIPHNERQGTFPAYVSHYGEAASGTYEFPEHEGTLLVKHCHCFPLHYRLLRLYIKPLMLCKPLQLTIVHITLGTLLSHE
jgi:hypothetical protein